MDRADAYDRDFYLWTQEQASALRRAGEARVNAPVDWENVAEEIESMGRSQRSEIRNRLKVLLAHILKWQHCPEIRDRNARQWRLTIEEQRDQIEDELADSPSLRPHAEMIFASVYPKARARAAVEAEVPERRFPAEPPFGFAEAMDRGFPPGLRISGDED